eukprot:1161210-Pelagomonas_calceolata.AAC.8
MTPEFRNSLSQKLENPALTQNEQQGTEKQGTVEAMPVAEHEEKVVHHGVLRRKGHESSVPKERNQPVNMNRTSEQGRAASGVMGSGTTTMGGLGNKDWGG